MNQFLKSLYSLSFKTPKILSIKKSIHSKPALINNDNVIINELCNSLRNGFTWDKLHQKFKNRKLNDSIIEEVLLDLNQNPSDAKKALSFFHWSAQLDKTNHGVSNYCITIHILIRARMLIDATALLESVVKKQRELGFSKLALVESLLSCNSSFAISNPIVFDLLVQVYAKMRMFDTAVEVCFYLEKQGFSLKIKSYNLLIHFMEKSDQNELIWKVYELMIQTRTYPNGETVKFMINGLCKEGNLLSFMEMLDKICEKKCSPAVIVNSSLVFRIIEHGGVDVGILILKKLLQKNMIIDSIAYSLIVFGEIKIGDLDSAWKVFEEMLKRGFKSNSFVYTSFIQGYCRDEKIKEAIRLFEEMEAMDLKPYNDTFNHLIMGCAKIESVEESLRFCEKMIERGLVPSCLAFNEMVGKLGGVDDLKRANATLTLMLDKKFSPNETTFTNLIIGFCKSGEVEEAIKLYHEMEFRSLSPGSLCFTSLIQSLCRSGKMGEAERYLKVMKDRSIVRSVHVYEALIVGYLEKGDKSRALQLYNEMVGEGLKISCSILDDKY